MVVIYIVPCKIQARGQEALGLGRGEESEPHYVRKRTDDYANPQGTRSDGHVLVIVNRSFESDTEERLKDTESQ